MERYDIAIIGTGPAGIEAAITARVRNKKIILLGHKNLSEKLSKAHLIQNYLGMSNISGEDMRDGFLRQLEDMKIEITEDKINAVYAMGEYFALMGNGTSYEADSVIIACGMTAVKAFEGENENLGRGVSYCATCDAALYRNKTAIVIGYSEKEEKEVEFLAERAEKVFYLPMYKTEFDSHENIEVMADKKPAGIVREDNKMKLMLEDGFIKADGIFILRESVAPSQLVPGLEMDKNHIAVDRKMKTNISGLFACGDIVGAPYQYIKAAGEGNVAALSAVSYLADTRK